MEGLPARQSQILALARENGKVSVEHLAGVFAVTPQTIRRDLNDLCERHLLQRVHGGAVAYSGVENMGYEARRMLAPAEKRAIGVRAAELIPDNCSLFMNIGTTTEQVAAALTAHRDLMVVTNNINVANILRKFSGIEVIIAGGVVRHADGGIVGEAAVAFISQFKVDYAVIGVSAIDEDGALLDYDYREVSVARAIIGNARHVILVADRMKLARSAPVRIGHLSQVNTFVTDAGLPREVAAVCDASGVRVEIASATNGNFV